MVAQPSPPFPSVEEYLALDKAGDEKHEYVDGRLYAMAGGTNAHDRIGNNVRALVNIHLGAGPCALHGPNVRLRIGPTVYYYPDAFVTCDEAVAASATELTAARLVVEILSDSTEAADRGEKFANYQTLAAFEEYLLVDGRRRIVEHFRRANNGDWLYHRYGPHDTVSLHTVGLDVTIASMYLASGL